MHVLAFIWAILQIENMDRFSYPFIYFNYWNPFSFRYTWSLKKISLSGGVFPYRPLQKLARTPPPPPPGGFLWKETSTFREGTFFIGRGGPGYFPFFWRKKSWPSHFLELMHDPSEIPKQKHLTLSPLSKTKITGSENNKQEVLLITAFIYH